MVGHDAHIVPHAEHRLQEPLMPSQRHRPQMSLQIKMTKNKNTHLGHRRAVWIYGEQNTELIFRMRVTLVKSKIQALHKKLNALGFHRQESCQSESQWVYITSHPSAICTLLGVMQNNDWGHVHRMNNIFSYRPQKINKLDKMLKHVCKDL